MTGAFIVQTAAAPSRLTFPVGTRAGQYRGAIGRDASSRVLLVDDDGSLRRVVVATLQAHPKFVVVGEAVSGRQAIDQAAVLKPDIVILDLGLPDLAATDVLSGLRTHCPQARVIVFTGAERDSAADLIGASAAASRHERRRRRLG